MRYNTLFLSAVFPFGSWAAVVPTAEDPCPELCALIPEICGKAGSSCVDGICTNLHWLSRDREPVSCEAAANMVLNNNVEILNISFADPVDAGRRGVRYGGVHSYMGPAIQVILRSRKVRDAVKAELVSGVAQLSSPFYQNFVNLLRQMYDTGSSGILDLGGSSLITSGSDGHSSFETLATLMGDLADISPQLSEIFSLRTSSTRNVFQFLNFPGSDRQYSVTDLLRAHLGSFDNVLSLPQLLTIGISRQAQDGSVITTSLDQPLEIDLKGIVQGGEGIRYRLVGVIRIMGKGYVLDYLDTDRNEWIHTKDAHFHVINGRPRNGGADPCIVFYERIDSFSITTTTTTAAAVVVPHHGIKGITNIGATCYFGAFLEVLARSEVFQRALAATTISADPKKILANDVLNHSIELCRELLELSGSPSAVNPGALIDSVRAFNEGKGFVIGQADDSYLSGLVLLDALTVASSEIREAMTLSIRKTRTCKQCERNSLLVTNELASLLPIPDPAKPTTLGEMLAFHFRTEAIEFGCESSVCGMSNSQQTRSSAVEHAPAILCLGINRDGFNENWEQIRLTTSVQFPFEFNLAEYVSFVDGSSDVRYRLVGIVRHGGGHYTADYFNRQVQSWVHADDHKVRLIPGNPNNTGSNNSILIYERV
jgi:ubiquitin C-terminal hydrolase